MQQHDDDIVISGTDEETEEARKAANLADKEHLKKINLDRFLYSCYEQEVLRKVGEKVQKPLWFGSDGGSQEPAVKEFSVEEAVAAMIKFYAESQKAVCGEAASPDNINIFSDMAVSLVADVQSLYFCKYGEHVPISTKLEKMRHTFWRSIRQNLGTYFPQIGEFIYSYLTWCYGMDDSQQAVNSDSLPPVGAFAPPPRAKLNARGELKLADRGGRGGSRNDARDRGNGRGGGGDRFRSSGPGRGDGRRSEGGRGARLGPKRARDRNFDRGLPQSEKREIDALRAVVDAIGIMRNDEGLEFVTLKPTNSFLRRMQHQEAATHGFFSYSQGEGKERTVVVTRKPVSHDVESGDDIE